MNKHDPAALPLKPELTVRPDNVRRRRFQLRSRMTLLLVLVMGVVLTGGIALGLDARNSAAAPGATVEPFVPVDTDGDGIFDHIETSGWRTQSGNIYKTDPSKIDTDGDSLNDGEEAGALTVNAKFENVYLGFSNPLLVDTDSDGLDDPDEVTASLDPYDSDTDDDLVQDGAEHHQLGTNPRDPDSDGDGLTDGDEVGAVIESSGFETVYAGFSNPLVMDSDGDGLGDADEADLGLNPFHKDSDGDGLDDGYEVEFIGTAPSAADTDGDGFDDKYEDENREDQGLDPLWVDEKVSKASYAIDFAKGAVLGDLDRVDSMAWLAGNLVSGGSSSIPVVGTVVGGLTDIRDAIGSAIHADWVGAGFSVTGAIPGGDLVAIPGKAAKFVARNPHLAAAVAAFIVTLKVVPEKIKVQAAKQVTLKWDLLRDGGGSEKGLLLLLDGRSNLDAIGSAMTRSIPVSGPPVKFMAWRDGESYLSSLYNANVKGVNTQVPVSIRGCVDTCTRNTRVFDVVSDGVAHESKVGLASLSESTRNQINADAWLVKNGKIKGAHWHFFPSDDSKTIGASQPVLDLLVEKGIKYTVHLPNTP